MPPTLLVAIFLKIVEKVKVQKVVIRAEAMPYLWSFTNREKIIAFHIPFQEQRALTGSPFISLNRGRVSLEPIIGS